MKNKRRERSPLLSAKIFKIQRLFGILNPTVAMHLLSVMIKSLQEEHHTETERQRCHRLIMAMLRQLLALHPFNRDVYQTLRRWSAIIPSNEMDSTWIWLLGRIHRDQNPPGKDERNNPVSNLGEDPERLSHLLDNTFNPVVLYESFWKAWEAGSWDLCQKAMARFSSTPYAPFVNALFGWAALGAGDIGLAQKFSEGAVPYFLRSNLMAEISFRNGERQAAKKWWEDSLRREPLQPWVYYRLWELEQPSPSENILKGKRIFIFIYTFNKRRELLSTLASLLASKIGSSRIVVLNNGSTNFLPNDLENDVRNVAQGHPVTVIHLPVNVGAPAARNWLWYLNESLNAEFIAYLDDDVILPEDWLIAYLQDFEMFSDAVVVGPKTLNPGSISTIQYVYRFFQKKEGQKIAFTPAAPFLFDLGQYSFRRPCLSTMGCCHLFHRKRWEHLHLPDFDICFSPSQVDDIEHDLQIWKNGGVVLYDGRVEVVHLHSVGRVNTQSRANWSHVWGNHMKMEAKFSLEELNAIVDAAEKMDDEFFRKIGQSSGVILPQEWFSTDK